MCVTVAKVGQGRPKSKDYGGSLMSGILPNMNVLGQVITVLEPENQKADQGATKVKVTYARYPLNVSYLHK